MTKSCKFKVQKTPKTPQKRLLELINSEMYENSQQNKSSAFLYLKNEQSENY